MKNFTLSPLSYMILITTIACFAGLLLGFDASVIGVSKDQVTHLFKLSDNQWSVIASASILGAVISLPICGKSGHLIGAKNTLILVAIGFLGGVIITASSHGMNQFLAGRFLTGVCIGMGSFMAPLYVSEIAPSKVRGALLLGNSIAIVVGQSFSLLMGYFIHNVSIESWRYFILMETVPSVILLIGMLVSPASPRWVAMKYGIENAREILKKIRKNEASVKKELKEIEEVLKETKHTVSFKKLFSRPLKNVMWLGIFLGIFQQLSGISTILYFGPVIFFKAGFQPISHAILATFFISLINLLAGIGSVFLIDRLGRRFLLLVGTLVAAVGLIALSILYSQEGNRWMLFFFLSVYIMGYCISLGSLFWIMIAEIYPLKTRGLAMSIAVSAETLVSLVVTLTFLKVVHYLDLSGAFWIYSIMNVFAAVFVYFYIPETKGVSLEKIEKNVNDGIRTRDLGRSS